MGLKEYRRKRNFSKTAEPAGKVVAGKKRALTFVIQKHAARRLHYDFRLEMEGVLKSWAVPKGVPTQKGDKRLAMQVEDHPLDYGGFEGIIPEGNYGAGTVMVWDFGIYEVLGAEPLAALEEGKLHIILRGKKLDGEWTLVKMRGRAEGDKQPWLLIKSGEDTKAISVKADNTSAVSGRTMEQIARRQDKTWKSNRAALSEPKSFRSKVAQLARSKKKSAPETSPQAPASDNLSKLPATKAEYMEPMKARLLEDVPPGRDWVFEIKWDGYRAMAVKNGGEVRLFSRSARDVTGDFFHIAKALEKMPAKNFVMDGEIVALDATGHPSFQRLQNYRQHTGNGEAGAIYYYVFDLLNLNNRSLLNLSLVQRKELLKALLSEVGEPIRFSASLEGEAKPLLAHARRNKLEGLIAKKRDSKYEPGRRSGAWVKLKCVHEQEFVIGGYTQPKGSRQYFGALLVGYYDHKTLLFASKVGTGFDTALLESLYRKLEKLRTKQCPFANLPTQRSSKFGQGITRSEMKLCTWVEPKLVCQIRFTEWTSEGGLRHPVFLGLRDDKKPSEVTRESAVV